MLNKLIVTSLLAAMSFGSLAEVQWEEDDHWFKGTFELKRRALMQDSAFTTKHLEVYQHSDSKRCYLRYFAGNHGSFTQVPCEDFLINYDKAEEDRKKREEDRRARVAQLMKEMKEAEKRYQEAVEQ